jgi:hypothetical protein
MIMMIRDKYDYDDEDVDHYSSSHDVIIEIDERSFNDNKGDVTHSYIQ